MTTGAEPIPTMVGQHDTLLRVARAVRAPILAADPCDLARAADAAWMQCVVLDQAETETRRAGDTSGEALARMRALDEAASHLMPQSLAGALYALAAGTGAVHDLDAHDLSEEDRHATTERALRHLHGALAFLTRQHGTGGLHLARHVAAGVVAGDDAEDMG